MATPRNPLRLKPAQVEGISHVTSRNGEVVDLHIEELEERIAPAICKPKTL
jgi:hypothetical protein